MPKSKSVYIDLDGTLIDREGDFISARPSAVAFLTELQVRYPGNVHLLTDGKEQAAETALIMAGLRQLIGLVVGRDSKTACDGDHAWVLVDNVPNPFAMANKVKFARLGCDYDREYLRLFDAGQEETMHDRWKELAAQHLIVCRFWGGGDDDEPLTTLLHEIERRLAEQE